MKHATSKRGTEALGKRSSFLHLTNLGSPVLGKPPIFQGLLVIATKFRLAWLDARALKSGVVDREE